MAENENNLNTRQEWQDEYQTTCKELTAAREEIINLRTRLQEAEEKIVGLSNRKQILERRYIELRYLPDQETE